MTNPIPISTLFIGLSGFIAFVLSYIVAMERISTRVWHGESKQEVATQPNYLNKPSKWAAFVENYTQKSITTKTSDDGVLQRKVRAFGKFYRVCPVGAAVSCGVGVNEIADFVSMAAWKCISYRTNCPCMGNNQDLWTIPRSCYWIFSNLVRVFSWC